ncbi:MAG: acetyltransferase [Chloroflexi bacterium]|nr:acetyltransferase [Chloroflexota bacterium]
MPELVIWGAGGHAQVVADIIRLAGEYDIVGFLDDVNPGRANEEFCGGKILGGREQFIQLKERGVRSVILAFGDCQARLRVADWVRDEGLSLITAIHPKAVVAQGARIEVGTVVAAGAVISPNVRIGKNVIINTCSSIDHGCAIADGVHISPGACLGGNVTVGRGAWIGIGATVVPRVKIGAQSIIGAGAVVLQDIPDHVVAYGNPARVSRRTEHDT